jgi:hypothetical protein
MPFRSWQGGAFGVPRERRPAQGIGVLPIAATSMRGRDARVCALPNAAFDPLAPRPGRYVRQRTDDTRALG